MTCTWTASEWQQRLSKIAASLWHACTWTANAAWSRPSGNVFCFLMTSLKPVDLKCSKVQTSGHSTSRWHWNQKRSWSEREETREEQWQIVCSKSHHGACLTSTACRHKDRCTVGDLRALRQHRCNRREETTEHYQATETSTVVRYDASTNDDSSSGGT